MYPMRSRTDSESVRTSRPSTHAAPPLSGKRPVSILMSVVLPLPLGPRNPKISPFSTRKLTSLTAVNLPNRRTRCSAEMAGAAPFCVAVAMELASRLQLHVRSHAGEDTTRSVVDANFHAEDLVDALFAGLHVAGKKLRLLIDLFDRTVENLVGKGIDAHFSLLAQADAADFGFGNVDADVDLVAFEKRGDGRVGRDEIAGADVENFDNRGGRSNDLAFAVACLVVGV